MLARQSSVPLLLCLLMAGFLAVLGLETKRNRFTRRIYGIALIVYFLVYAYITLLMRRPASERRINLELFWTVRAAVQWKDGRLTLQSYRFFREMVLNILLYVPLGLLLGGLCGMGRKAWMYGIGLSLVTECVQYIFRLGLMELDDVMHNTFGLAIGFVLFYVARETGRALGITKKSCV